MASITAPQLNQRPRLLQACAECREFFRFRQTERFPLKGTHRPLVKSRALNDFEHRPGGQALNRDLPDEDHPGLLKRQLHRGFSGPVQIAKRNVQPEAVAEAGDHQVEVGTGLQTAPDGWRDGTALGKLLRQS